MLLSCKQSARLLSQSQDRKLAFGERMALRVHLAICDGCRNVRDQFDFLRQAARALSESEPGK
jgi:hypothetical protein